ncbi:vasodilator-stimulated phosphoprotein-like [Cricetulus griseus]|uniref:vasodilator-stimulated phosphoprotein-like n=1 Tax=Cricetulus griseus TaxID=10029 RepID=UPI0015C3DDC0|nr:vasodilator-stimulated phosphoprotein-like [Cricetulus griseus]
MDPRGNSVLPPAAAAAAPSAGSLRPAPPPPPPSSAAAAAAAGKGAEETASLPLPTARAQLGPTVRKSATSVRRVVARAPNVTGATRRGAGLRRLAGPREAPSGSPAARGWRRAHLSLSRGVFPGFFLLRRSEARGAKPLAGWASSALETDAPTHAAEACSQTPRATSLPLAPACQRHGLLSTRSPPDFLQLPGRHVGGRRATEAVRQSSPHFFLVLGLLRNPALERLNSFSFSLSSTVAVSKNKCLKEEAIHCLKQLGTLGKLQLCSLLETLENQ